MSSEGTLFIAYNQDNWAGAAILSTKVQIIQLISSYM